MERDFKSLLAAAKKGDSAASESLYNATYKSAYATVFSITKNANDVEDILQDAYIRVFSKLDTVENPERFQSWVNCIVANQAKDWLRKKKPTLFGDIGTSGDGEESDFDFEATIQDKDMAYSPEESLDKKTMQDIFSKMFESLPEDQRLCIIMYYRDNLSVQEIADTLDVPVPTVKSRLLYAKKKIKASVEEEERTSGIKLYSGIPFVLFMLRQEAEGVNIPAFASLSARLATSSAATSSAASGGTAASTSAATTTSSAASSAATAAAKSGASAAVKAGLAATAAHPVAAALIAGAIVVSAVAAPIARQAIASSDSVSSIASSGVEFPSSSDIYIDVPYSADLESAGCFGDYMHNGDTDISSDEEISQIMSRFGEYLIATDLYPDGSNAQLRIYAGDSGPGLLFGATSYDEGTYYAISRINILGDSACDMALTPFTRDDVPGATPEPTVIIHLTCNGYDEPTGRYNIQITRETGEVVNLIPTTEEDIYNKHHEYNLQHAAQ